jgi:hypothetical protein
MSQPMVEVTAPATMLEGYKFRAVYEGVQFPVIVVSDVQRFFETICIF